MASQITVPAFVEWVKKTFGADIEPWKGRQVIDLLEAAGKLSVVRVGNYRVIRSADIEIVVDEFRRLGLIASEAVV